MNTLTTTQYPITSANAKGTAMHAGTHKNHVIGTFGAARLKRRLGLLGLFAVFGLAGNALAASATRSSSFDYDPVSGLLIKEVVEPGDSNLCLVTTYTYDSFGNKTGATTRNCNGSATSIPGGTVEAAAPAAGSAALFTARTSTTTYSNDGRFPVISANALSQSETKVFDERFGSVTKLTGPNGLATEWAYDGFGRKTLEKRADGNGTKWTYEYCSSVTVNGASGTATCPTIAGAVGAFVITNTLVAGPIDIVAGTTGAQNGPITKVYFDTLSREIRTETQGYDGGSTASQAVYKDTEYDALGRINRSSQPYYAGATPVWTDFDYDVLGRQVSQSAPDDNNQPATTTVSYNGLTVSVTNAKSQVTTKTSNVVGQVVTVTDAYNKTLTQSYDPFGNLVQTTDVLGNTTTLTYDARGRKTQMKDPDMGTWSYAYNALGELTSQTNARSQVTTLAYDVLGRMLTRTEVGLTSTWTYDKYADGSACAKGVGKLCEAATSGGYKRKQVYDSLGRPSSTTETVGSAYTYGSTYDANGRVATVSYPSGLLTTQNVYTALGYLKEVRNADATNALYWRADVIDAQGRVTRQTYGNNVVTLNTFSSTTGRLLSSSAGVNLANNAVQSIAYAYDSLGNLTSRNDGNSGVSANYGYDNLNRLTAETRIGGALTTAQTTSFTYDPIGNLTTRTEAAVTLTYTYPVSGATSVRPHAVSSIAGTVNNVTNPGYTYDAAGNMVSATGRGDLTWASFDKLSRVTRIIGSNTSQLDYTYDADHDRVKEVYNLAGVFKRSTVYLNPAGGAGLFYEEETGPAVSWGTRKKHYINTGTGTVGVLTWVGGGNPAPWEMRYWHKDHLGSVMAVSKEDGSVTERMAYEPFGKRRNSNGTTDAAGTLTTATDRGFTGHEMMDDVGLINMNGRVYDPAISRFMSADPYVQTPDNLQSYNRYAYAFNSPTGGIDPSGYDVFYDPSGGSGAGSFVFGPPNLSIGLSGGSGGSRSSSRSSSNASSSSTPKAPNPPPVAANSAWTNPTTTNFRVSNPNTLDYPDGDFLDLVSEGRQEFWRGVSGEYRSVMKDPSIAYNVGGNLRGTGSFLLGFFPGSSLPDVGAELGEGSYRTAILLLGTEFLGPIGKDIRLATRLDRAATVETVGAASRAERSFWTKSTEFGGTKVYQRDDLINPGLVDARGRTNLERMERGLAPIGPDGKSINLHHMLQSQDGPIAEVTQTFHQQNRSVIHINPSTTPSGIDRSTFDAWRTDYWLSRSADFR